MSSFILGEEMGTQRSPSVLVAEGFDAGVCWRRACGRLSMWQTLL